MRPGMPPGRKHFRRSRDAPIRKGLLDQSLVKELTLPYSECLNKSIILDARQLPRIQLKRCPDLCLFLIKYNPLWG